MMATLSWFRTLEDLEGPRDLSTLFVVLFLACVLYFLRNIHRAYFHPLAKFPGPREAAISTKWVERVTQSGWPEEEFERLHKYHHAEAIRISPNELHISDVNLYKVIFSQSKPFLKYPPFYDSFHTPHSLFTETDPARHKERRKLLNPLFSKTGVFKLEPIIHDKIQILMRKITRLQDKSTINVYDAFRCLTTEVIMEFAFAKSANMLEESPDTFESWFLKAFDAAAKSVWKTYYSPNLSRFAAFMPATFVKALDPELSSLFKLLKFAESCLGHYEEYGNTTPHPVVFETLQSLSYSQKCIESMDILVAGADTTASTLTAALLHILPTQHIRERLADSLKKIDFNEQGQLALSELEKVEYLVACVKESLRIGLAVPGRLPRVVPNDLPSPLIVDGKQVPPGTIVSMSAYTMHFSEDIWGANARNFNPDRWLTPDAKKLDQYLCTFSKGPRMCIGQNLATAEITIVLGYLFKCFQLSLPPDFQRPKVVDLFTLEYSKPGVHVHFEPAA